MEKDKLKKLIVETENEEIRDALFELYELKYGKETIIPTYIPNYNQRDISEPYKPYVWYSTVTC